MSLSRPNILDQAPPTYQSFAPQTIITIKEPIIPILQRLVDQGFKEYSKALKSVTEEIALAKLMLSTTSTEIAEINCPTNLTPYPFQIEGAKFALSMTHSLIADEPGLGKTIQAILALNTINPTKTVIVCPACVKVNWSRELAIWITKDRSIGIAYGDDLNLSDITIINYDILHRHTKDLISNGIDLLILDEVHAIKDSSSRRSKLAKELLLAAKRSISLSGTPILNRPIEIFPLLNSIRHPIAVNRQKFSTRYCNGHLEKRYIKGGHGEYRQVWVETGASNLPELSAALKSVMIRRKKADVLTELPPKRYGIVNLDVSTPELDKIKANSVSVWEKYGSKLTGTDALKGIADEDATSTVGELSEIARCLHEEALAKLPSALDEIHQILTEENSGDNSEKIIVFAHHRDVVEALYDGLKDFNPVKLYGGMTPKDKQLSIDTFQTDPTCKVFIGSITAAGEGITLTASSRVLFVELAWVPGKLLQAEDRAHRVGQAKPVLIQYLVCPDGLDSRIASSLVKKQLVIDRIVD